MEREVESKHSVDQTWNLTIFKITSLRRQAVIFYVLFYFFIHLQYCLLLISYVF